MVPDQLPDLSNGSTEQMRREYAMKNIRQNLAGAVERLHTFLETTDPADVVKRVHTAKTEIVNDSDETEIIPYYTLWTDFADMRLTESGQLLRSDHYSGKYAHAVEHGFDHSHVVSLNDLRRDTDAYRTIQLVSLATTLDKFLRPKQ